MRIKAFMAGLLLTLAYTPAAGADTIPLGNATLHSTEASNRTCSAPLIENPFTRWGDRRNYVMAPDGSFEAPAAPGWQLFGGSTRVAEADPVDLGAADGAGMMSLPARGSVISPTMCVDLDYPTFRLLVKAAKPNSSEFKIEIVYPDAPKPAWEELKKFDGAQFTSAGSGWRLTDDIDMKPDLGGKTAGYRRVAFRFTALSGSWRLDDLYVDPRRRC